jgi:hypothetical protein
MTQNPKAQATVVVRALITFPRDLYETPEQLTEPKKVSLAWIVRDAPESYFADVRGH